MSKHRLDPYGNIIRTVRGPDVSLQSIPVFPQRVFLSGSPGPVDVEL